MQISSLVYIALISGLGITVVDSAARVIMVWLALRGSVPRTRVELIRALPALPIGNARRQGKQPR